MQGLTVTNNFLTSQEMDDIVAFARQAFEENYRNNENIVCTKFGYGEDVTYKGNNSHLNGDMISNTIPEVFVPIIDKLNLQVRPDSVYILRYLPGQRLFPHIDARSAGPIVSMVDVYGTAQLFFRKGDEEDVVINMEAGTLVQIEGEARTNWRHGVHPVEEERISVVFRKFTPEV